MIIERVLAPVHSLGPGERVCLWTRGCSKRCEGCISPELQPFSGQSVDAETLGQTIIKLAEGGRFDGLTVSGGDPFEQPEELLVFLGTVRKYFKDILVYTGFELNEIKNGEMPPQAVECLKYIDVLIDGRYVKSLNTSDCVLRGSANQIIHFLNSDLKSRYLKYMEKGRMIESFAHGSDTIITGILNEEE